MSQHPFLKYPVIGFFPQVIKGLPKILICCVLTLMFYIPGVVYAFSVIDSDESNDN